MGSEPTAEVHGRGAVDAAFEGASLDLCARYPEGSWFRDSHLVEGKGWFQRIVRDLFELTPPGTERPVLDVGCYNGFFCYLLHKLGCRSSGSSAPGSIGWPAGKGGRPGAPAPQTLRISISLVPRCPSSLAM